MGLGDDKGLHYAKGRPVELGRNPLIVGAMPAFVDGCEERWGQIVGIDGGGDAGITEPDAGGEGMGGDVLAAGPEIKPDETEDVPRQCDLGVVGEIAAQGGVVDAVEDRAEGIKQRDQAVAQGAEEAIDVGGGEVWFVAGEEGVVRRIFVAKVFSLATGELDLMREICLEDGKIARGASLHPGLKGAGRRPSHLGYQVRGKLLGAIVTAASDPPDGCPE